MCRFSVSGVGWSTAKKLSALGVTTVTDLKAFPMNRLCAEFGESQASLMKHLCQGVDNSPVKCTGLPQVTNLGGCHTVCVVN